MSEDNYIKIKRRGCSVYIHLKYRNLNDKAEFYGFAVNCYKKVRGRLTVPVEFETWKNQINIYGAGKPTVVLDLSIRDKAVGDFGYDRLMYIYYHFDTMPCKTVKYLIENNRN